MIRHDWNFDATASVPVVVIGAGQAGLSVSRELSERGVEHIVLERSRVGQAWRDRWDSFTLVTPNWSLDLPGSPYDGDDPEGHVPRDAIVDYLMGYQQRWSVPVREGVCVEQVTSDESARFRLTTSSGVLRADTVVVCSGAFQRPYRPPAGTFPAGLVVLDATEYRNADALPPGRVLVIGSGQTGCQLGEELHLAGRDVVLSCGRAPWGPRRLDGVDIVTWLHRVRFFDQRLLDLPTPSVRLLANPQATGAGGGHDLHYRTLQDLGVLLVGRLAGTTDHRVGFADDLAASVAFGDARWADARAALTNGLPALGYPIPEMPIPAPFRYEPVSEIDLRDVGAVIFTTGFRPDYRWIEFPILDELGFPITTDGASPVPGLYFCGVHFMRVRRSGFLFGVGDDAAIVAETIAVGARVASRSRGRSAARGSR